MYYMRIVVGVSHSQAQAERRVSETSGVSTSAVGIRHAKSERGRRKTTGVWNIQCFYIGKHRIRCLLLHTSNAEPVQTASKALPAAKADTKSETQDCETAA